MRLPSKELRESIISDELQDVTEEVIEVVIDEVSESELINKLPIVGTLKALYKTGQSIRDAIFLKKALFVLLELANVPLQNRIDFIDSLEEPFSGGSEIILNAIDRLESNEKAVIFGRLCKLRALRRIELNEFMELSKLIQDAYLPDLKEFYASKISKSSTSYKDSKFVRLGLVSLMIEVEDNKILQVQEAEQHGHFVVLDGVHFITDYSDLGLSFTSVYSDLFRNE